MDRTVKILLGMIAASLFMLNLQLAGVSFVKEAHAEWDTLSDSRSLKGIAKSLDSMDTSLQKVSARHGASHRDFT